MSEETSPQTIGRFAQWVAGRSGRPRIYVCALGPEKAGKTHLALGFPGPVGFLSLDKPSPQVLDHYANYKTIYHKIYEIPTETMVPGQVSAEDSCKFWMPWWMEIRGAFEELVELGRAGRIRTLAVDNAGAMWAICRMARLGKLTQVQPLQYVAVNSDFSSMLARPYTVPGLNVCLLHRERDVYVGKDKSGLKEIEGFGATPNIAGMNVRVWREPRVPGDDGFRLKVINTESGPQSDVVYTGPAVGFYSLAELAWPNTPADYWEDAE